MYSCVRVVLLISERTVNNKERQHKKRGVWLEARGGALDLSSET